MQSLPGRQGSISGAGKHEGIVTAWRSLQAAAGDEIHDCCCG
uniref:Uncharacterized protein n=1 Tax=Faecalibaculum rodentium TaxID=1702221 RepID=A0A140DTV7_9FIRM|nr:hypothetical protein AALO17_09500 [Faecalibaculum rodentium]